MAHEGGGERRIRERAPRAAEGGREPGAIVRSARDDRGCGGIPGRGEAKVVGHRHRQERGDEEGLGAGLAHAAAARLGDVVVALAEGVADLERHGRELARCLMAVEEAERVEDVAGCAQRAEQPHRAGRRLEPSRADDRLDLRAQGPILAGAVVAVAQGVEGRPVVAEEAKRPVEAWRLVEVDQELREPVGEPMAHRLQPLVDHGPFVEGARDLAHAACSRAGADGAADRKMRPDSLGARHGRRTPPRASATASPDCKASSWKPAPK